MSSVDLLQNVNFNPVEYDPHTWFIEQDSFKNCAYDDEPIDIPVLIISEYTMAHYKYYISICCETNLDDFYECLGNQPLKIVFSHLIDDEYVKRHGFDNFPDTNLSRKYHIKNNELYLDTNEVELDTENSQLEGHGNYSNQNDLGNDDSEESDFSDYSDSDLEQLSEDEDTIEGLEKIEL